MTNKPTQNLTLCKTVLDEHDKVWAQHFSSEKAYIIRFPDLGEFTYDTETKAIACCPVPGIEQEVIRDLLINQVQPLAKSSQGHLVLHASAVKIGTGAVLFLGKSGAGKSTLATFFSLKNHRLICEDGAVFSKSCDDIVIEPGHHSIRLWPDSYTGLFDEENNAGSSDHGLRKLRVIEPRNVVFSNKPEKVCAVFYIDESETEELELNRLTPRNAFSSCLNHMFVLDDRDFVSLVSHFDQLTRLVNAVPHFRLCYPRRYSELSRVRTAILNTCSEVGIRE